VKLEPLVSDMIDAMDVTDRTKETYRYALAKFLAYLESQGEKPTTEALYERVLYDYRQWLLANQEKRTAHTYLGIAARFVDWLDLHHGPLHFSANRAQRLLPDARKHEGYEIRPVDENFHRILDYYVNKPLPEKLDERLDLLRNRALIAMLYDTACRVSELAALNRADVLDGKVTRLTIRATKGNKPRVVFVSSDTQTLIQTYIQARSDGLRAPLFIQHGRNPGKRMSRAMMYYVVQVAATDCGLTGISPHSFRHQRAQDLLNGGMPLEWVSTYLGHKHIDTTRIIYAWQTKTEMLEKLVKEHGGRPDKKSRKEDTANG
jgi:integrase